MSFPGIHLLGEVNNLANFSGILENHQVMHIQTDGAMLFVFVKEILNDIKDTDVAMVTTFGK